MPIEFTITVLKVTNLRPDLVKNSDTIKVCWKRNSNLTETAPARVIDTMAVFDNTHHQLKMISRMEQNPGTKELVSKVTQLQLKLNESENVIAEVDLDLAAFAY